MKRTQSKEFLDHLNELDMQYRQHRNKIIADYFFYMGAKEEERKIDQRDPDTKPCWWRRLLDRRKAV